MFLNLTIKIHNSIFLTLKVKAVVFENKSQYFVDIHCAK